MKLRRIFLPSLAAAATLVAIPPLNLKGNWTLKESLISYTVNHPLKTATGTGSKTRGKGRCSEVECEFLLGVPAVSFDSGDSNRDLHMLEVTKGAAFPVVTARAKFHPSALSQNPLKIDFEIEFAGSKAMVRGVTVQITDKGQSVLQVDGSFTLKLSDFAVTKPALLGLAIDDEVPIRFSSTWIGDVQK